jgi:hypothetical protein
MVRLRRSLLLFAARREKQDNGEKDPAEAAMTGGPHGGSDHSRKIAQAEFRKVTEKVLRATTLTLGECLVLRFAVSEKWGSHV